MPTAIVYAVNKGFTNTDDYYTSHLAVRTDLVFGSNSNFRTTSEPTALDNSSLSTVSFAPGEDPIVKRKKTAVNTGEKLDFSRHSHDTSSPV